MEQHQRRKSSLVVDSSSPPKTPMIKPKSPPVADEQDVLGDSDRETKVHTSAMKWCFSRSCSSSVRMMVLLILCLQNSLFTVLRRYSQGILLETYSKYECLLVGEVIKIFFSAWMIRQNLISSRSNKNKNVEPDQLVVDESFRHRLLYLLETSKKMMVLALIYGAMNILSFVALRNIGAGMFTVFAQAKIFTTALFSAIILNRKYSWTQWRALVALMLGVLLFSEPVWNSDSASLQSSKNPEARPWLGTMAVLLEVSLSGFASIYFEKVIKLDPLQLSIWERNFQLALGSVPVYIVFLVAEAGGTAGFMGGWSWLAVVVAFLGAAGGLLVALSIKYGDSILKTLATTGAIVLSSVLDRIFLDGPLTPIMMIAGGQVIIAICNYTFDTTPAAEPEVVLQTTQSSASFDSKKDTLMGEVDVDNETPDEEVALLKPLSLRPSSSDMSGEMSSTKGD
jgi:solute carrier family 35 (UDP-sugar transporter), member A1/2/3